MGAEAVFTRRQTNVGVEYSVTPASVSGAWLFMAWFVTIAIAGTLAIQATNTKGLTSLACIGGAVLVLLLCITKVRDAKAGRGTPVTLVLTANSLQVGEKNFALDDIAELYLVDPQGKPTARSLVFAGGSGVGGGLAMGASAGLGAAIAILDSAAAAQAARSLSLSLRRRSHSKPEPIVSGFTADTGEALLGDISETIARR